MFEGEARSKKEARWLLFYLNQIGLIKIGKWWPLADLNCGPTDYESTALTTELRGLNRTTIIGEALQGV